jgi:hypothetical protein
LRRAELSPRGSQALAWPRVLRAERSLLLLAAALQSPPLLPTLSAQDGARRARRHQVPVELGRAELPLGRRPLNRRLGLRE